MNVKRYAGLLASTVAAVALGAGVASAGEIVWWNSELEPGTGRGDGQEIHGG